MRRAKKDRGKPLSVHDANQLAKFRAEMEIYNKLRDQGASHVDAMRTVFGKDA